MKKLLLLLLCLPFFGFGQEIIYSTNTDKELIRTDINGNSPTILHTAPGNIKSVVMDNINNKVYWNEFINGSTGVSALMRSDINSFMPEVVLNVSTGEMTDIHLMKDTNLIYWRDISTDDIYNNELVVRRAYSGCRHGNQTLYTWSCPMQRR